MEETTLKKIALIFALPLALSGCIEPFEKPSGNASNRFDGVWQVEWVVSEETQPRYGVTYTCKKESRNALMFIEDGQVGTPDFGPYLGEVDSKGVMLTRIPVGEFRFTGAHNKPAERILSGNLQPNSGTGLSVFAVKGSDAGCYGDAVYTRLDVSSFPGDRAMTLSMNASVNLDGENYPTSKVITPPPSAYTYANFKLELPEKTCYGWWARNKGATSGKWHAYCGNQQTVSGTWEAFGKTLTYSGSFRDGREIKISSTLP